MAVLTLMELGAISSIPDARGRLPFQVVFIYSLLISGLT
jgi:hypothetical protein